MLHLFPVSIKQAGNTESLFNEFDFGDKDTSVSESMSFTEKLLFED